MDRKCIRTNRMGWAPPPIQNAPRGYSTGQLTAAYPPSVSSLENVNPYESIDEERRSRHGSGVGFGGPNYHGGSSREGLDILNNYRERSGSEGDGEEESPPLSHLHHRNQQPQQLLHLQPHQSLHRQTRSRPGHPHYQTPTLVQQSENPYQQPYLGRRPAAESPNSENGSDDDATLTDSEIPFNNQSSTALPLQNGGLLMSGNLDFLTQTQSGRGNSLKRTLNSNGKSTTGIGLGSHGSSSNHDSLIDQFVMHTPGGKIYIPQGDTPKNSSSDYKTSPGSSPSKKTSGSLLYKETMHMGTLRDSRSRHNKSEEDDIIYKLKGYCPWKKLLVIFILLVFIFSLVFNILFFLGVMPIVQEKTIESPGVEGGHGKDIEDEEQSIPHNGGGNVLHEEFIGSSREMIRMKRNTPIEHEDEIGSGLDPGSMTSDSERSVLDQGSGSGIEALLTSGYSDIEERVDSNFRIEIDGKEEIPIHYEEYELVQRDQEITEAEKEQSSNPSASETELKHLPIVQRKMLKKIKRIGLENEDGELGTAPSSLELKLELKKQKKIKTELSNNNNHFPAAEYSMEKKKDLKEISNFISVMDPLSSPFFHYNNTDKEMIDEPLSYEISTENLVEQEFEEEPNNKPQETRHIDPNKENLFSSSLIQEKNGGSVVMTMMKVDSGSYPDPNSIPENGYEEKTLTTTGNPSFSSSTSTSPSPRHGGVCECYCPCLDKSYEQDTDYTYPQTSPSTDLLNELVQGSGSGADYSSEVETEGEMTSVELGSGEEEWGSGQFIDENENEVLEQGEIISDLTSGDIETFPRKDVEKERKGDYLSVDDEKKDVVSLSLNETLITSFEEPLSFRHSNEEPSEVEVVTSTEESKLVTKQKISSETENDIPELLDENSQVIINGSDMKHSYYASPHLKKNSDKNQNQELCSCSGQIVKSGISSTVYYFVVNNTGASEGGPGKFPAVNSPPDTNSFTQIQIGSRHKHVIGPYGYWNMQFYQPQNQYVMWEVSVPRGASIGLYARRNALPTHTQYDIVQFLRGFKTIRNKRSSPPSVSKELSNFLEQGHWFLSLYNDDSDPQEVVFAVNVSEEMTEGCPNGCTGNGQCQTGHCQCNPGFGGEDCSKSICPVLCSGKGEYFNGECSCNPGWKGKECNLRHDECQISDCHGHGKCVNGKCSCVRGYKGEFCEEVDCPHPTCTGHGFCLNGSCICKKGWRGSECSEPDNEALACLPDCSGHGVFSLDAQLCTCEPRWTGEDCSQELCDTDCGSNGICISGACQCSEGWTGSLCNQRVCDKRCADHGQCKNGTCLCVTGWNGKHCTLEGCPNSCSGHGQCKANSDGFWECKCHNGWTGNECSVMMEQNCNDAKDNDKDGLTDCEDPECCSQPQCEKSQLCVSARKPIDILLRKQPPAITASFFEKMKFLIEEGSLQSYAKQDAFNGSRSGVVRGRVVTPNGSGLMGVRVSSSSPTETLGGFTLTQDDGWFDLMVNGGGAVTLQFGRIPFNQKSRTIFVPWNEVVIIDTVIMGLSDERGLTRGQACESHDYESMKPVVLATWKHGFQGDCRQTSVILVESQVVQESIQIPGTGINLMYHSSRAAGYSSTIQLQLTSETIPSSLKRIHLRITIEGVLFEKTFEADPDIKYTYSWNRLNVYRQRVYGVTTAIVKVGYEYENCADVIWDVQSTTLSGHDMSISDVGGWNLDIHHRYNFHEGIIQKGDGSNIYLKHRPKVILTTMGNGYQRSLDCNSDCNGIAKKQKLLAPVALAPSPDGTLYVGDFNLIRKINVDGSVRNVVRLNTTRVSYRYHMALSPVDNILYISDPESHQIIRVRSLDDTGDTENNWEPVIGSGERCLPGDEAHCGDDALAKDAKLAYPKGVAISSDNILYFADGTNIRKVDRDGIISTVIGNHQHKSHFKPIPCEGTVKVEEVYLRWPTELAVNPVDNSLYIVDDHMVLKLTGDNRIRIIAGRSIHCPVPQGGYENDYATHTSLVSPQSMTFSSNGDLYVAESDGQRVSRVRLVSTDGKISHFAGAESKCNCLDRGCSCFEEDHYLAATTKFNTISSIAMSADGTLHIADQGNYRIRSIQALIPTSTQPTESRQYEIFSPETQEIYIFNRFGQHVATKNIVTGETLYTFLYNVNMSNGKLSSITDSSQNKIQIWRDYSLQVKSIENAQAHKFNLRMSRKGMLQEFSTPNGYNLTFDYLNYGLLKSRQDSSGRSSVYSYDEFGRLTMAISPTGQVITLSFDLSKKGARVTVARDQNLPSTVLIRGSTVYRRIGKLEEITSVQPDGNVILLYPWSQVVTTESIPYNILGDISPVLSDSFPIPGKQKMEIAGDLVNRVEWRYVARKEGRGKNKQVVQVDKKMRVNGENILMVEYDRETKSELLFIDDRNEILNVTYDQSDRPLKWSPSHGFAQVDQEYDRFGRLVLWKWDSLSESYEYDRSGRLSKVQFADGTTWTNAYKDQFTTLPMKMTTGGGSDYLLEYDNSGSFESLTTPRGHIHNFGITQSIGNYEYLYKSPSSRDNYRVLFNDLGQVVSVIYPQNSGRINYVYSNIGKMEAQVAGIRSARFTYHDNTGLLKIAEVSQSSFQLKVEYRYHGGILKEERDKYGENNGLHNVHLKYQYDGNARIAKVEGDVNGKSVPTLTLKKSQNTGMLESLMDLIVITNSFNQSTLQDSSNSYTRILGKDNVGRLQSLSLSVKGSLMYKLEIEYNTGGKIKHRKMTIGRSVYADNVQYGPDGHVTDVLGSGNWKYIYDENGNPVQMVEQGERSSLIYDSGDRVIQVGELLRYTYDSRGFLVQRGNEKFQYDDKGLLIHAVRKDAYKLWFFYDQLDRLVSWKDDKGNLSQFLYGNPETPNLITHLHYPLTGKTILYLYDDSNNLLGMQTSDSQRYYVATDQNGSPLGVFNVHGTIIKEIHRTPFGKVVRDTSPDFYLPIDFHGGIVERHTGLVILNGRPYDPTIGQWMVPSWDSLPSSLKVPTDIFTYRFRNNDPITPLHEFTKSRMNRLQDWLSLFGYETKKIFGQNYIKPHIEIEPKIDNRYLGPEFRVVSALDCMAHTVTSEFQNFGFSHESKLNPERMLNNGWDIMNKLAYKRTAFGPGLLVSRIESGKTLISTIDNTVVQGVITSVLNGSLFVDFKSAHQSNYYFVKDNPLKLRDDMEELKRLGGWYNISVHEAENGIKELKLSSGDMSISVRYGTNVEEEYQRLIKHAHRRAIERAWEEEKKYISMGLDGRRAWTEEEKEQLLLKGLVLGYRASDLFSIHKFPQLADDPNNVLFQKDSRRKRRKSSKRHHD